MKSNSILNQMFVEQDKDFLNEKITNQSAYKAWDEQADISRKMAIALGALSVSIVFVCIYLLIKVLT